MVTTYSHRQAAEFRRIFKASLADYWLPYPLGFDVVRFDDEVAKSGVHESCRDRVRVLGGSEAVILIEELLGIR